MNDSNKIMKNKVGLTVLAGIIILLILLIIVGTDEYFFSKTYNLVVCIDDASGLVNGAPVLLGGVKIGNVEKIDFLPDKQKDNIHILLKVLSSCRMKITTGTFAEIRGLGILGDKYVYLSVGMPGESPVPDFANIPFKKGIVIENLAKDITPITTELKSILINLHRMTDSMVTGNGTFAQIINQPALATEISRVAKHADDLITAIDSREGTTGQLIHNKQLYSDLNEIIITTNKLLSGLQNGKGSAGKFITSDSLYNNINSTVGDLRGILSANRSDTTIVGSLLSDKRFLDSIKNLINELNGLVEDVKNNPRKYLKVTVF
jgi:phospholipid/cholesterol/gamma-HCH transport system substrate-binding protein